jgi:hypothetical protein
MATANSTPGPWETVGATRVWKTGEVGGAVCILAEPEIKTSSDFKEVYPTSERWTEAMANARLIAESPAMRDLLTEIEAFGVPRFNARIREILDRIDGK